MHSFPNPTQAKDSTVTYVRGASPDDFWAHFRSGASVHVVRGRGCHYPELASAAPSTRGYYELFAKRFPHLGRVLDAGCGSGVGTRVLARQYRQVLAVDHDPKALAFCREFSRRTETLQANVEDGLSIEPCAAAVVADVLGHTDSPLTFLRGLRRNLSEGAPVFVVEARAELTQRLEAPARRAFSSLELARLLESAGFHFNEWIAEDSSFLVCSVRAREDGLWQEFESAERCVSDAEREPSRTALQRALKKNAEFSAKASGHPRYQTEALLLEARLGWLEQSGDRTAEALLAAQRSAPGDARASARLSRLMLAVGAVADGLELALAALRVDPTLPEAANAFASAVTKLGHEDRFGAWRAAHALSPADPTVASALAEAAAARGDTGFGIQVFKQVRSYGDMLPADFCLALAWMLDAEGKTADARLEARTARALAPKDPEVQALCAHLGC
ncbi:MAG: methyltransferase domain-containing protein [Polyangiaceae bacterium]